MKPLYLEFCGINSFSETAKIDFEKLLSGGVFGIFGDTGSGKSTILDSIHFALYGKIERASGVDSINYKSDKATVSFEFELTSRGKRSRFGVVRERRRKNNVVKASLYEYVETGAKIALAEGAEEVNKKVEEILGLSFDEFKKCIALPQGEFASLVKATNSERVKLVAKIFDLEKYGEKLASSIRGKHAAAKLEAETLLARMGENQPISSEDEERENARLEEDKKRLSQVEEELKQRETEYLEEEKKLAAKKEYDSLCASLLIHENKRSVYEEKRNLLDLLPKAKAVTEAEKERNAAEREYEKARLEKEQTELKLQQAELKKEQTQTAAENSGLKNKVEQATLTLVTLQAAQADMEACRQAKEQLDECLTRYKKTDKHYEKEDFGGIIKGLEEQIETLGEDLSFSEFLLAECKDMLLVEAYGEFRKDLHAIASKYPQTQGQIERLIEKYTPYAVGSEKSFDVASAKLRYEEKSKRRKQAMAALEQVKQRKTLYEDNEKEKQLIAQEGKIYRETYERAKEKIAGVEKLGTLPEAETLLEELKRKIEKQEEELKEAERNVLSLVAQAETKSALEKHALLGAETAKQKLIKALQENGFEKVIDAQEKLFSIGSEEQTREEVDEYFSRLGALKMRKQEIDESAFKGASEENLESLLKKKTSLSNEKSELVAQIAVGKRKISEAEQRKEKYKTLETQYEAAQTQCMRWDKLRQLIDKNKFMSFIASEYLQEICVSASGLLLSLTGGRYYLRYDEEFKAVDNLNGGIFRSVKTLSGGETFLVSLALALSLSSAICEKSLRPIEFFFLDEGFGTLDEKLVDVVMDGLEKLKSKHFSIGVISHVEELKHRIENKIVVSGATNSRGSVIKTEVLA